VYVVGAGAVGRYLGELFARTGAQVSYAPRDPAAIVPVAADLAVVATKAFDTAGAVATLQRALGDGAAATTFLCPQNGVGNEELLAEAFGPDAVVSCALTVPVGVDAEGRSVAANSGGIAVAPVGSVAANWLVAALERTDVPVRVLADWRAMKWSKLALNIVANASCAILDVLPARIVAVPALFDLEVRAVAEAFAVMDALGLQPVDLPRYPVRALRLASRLPRPIARAVLGRRVAGARGAKPPSLLLDARSGRKRSEVGALNGAIAAAGARLGVATPVNTVFAETLAAILEGRLPRERFREHPEALLALLEG
jgi:2-dehydropantoate 2-reductase